MLGMDTMVRFAAMVVHRYEKNEKEARTKMGIKNEGVTSVVAVV